MDTKSAFELIRQRRREKHIEDVLFAYPYLIDPSLISPRRQVSLSKDSRADLRFDLENGTTVIVEIKRGPVTLKAVEQLLKYRKHLLKAHAMFQGYLLGTGISEEAGAKLQKRGADIVFKQLGKDVPFDIVVCRQCRKARDSRLPKCLDDGVTDVL